MEEETKSVKITQNISQTVDVPVELIQNIRGIFDVINTRVHWKSHELLPMGVLVKQLDDIIKSVQQ